MQILPQNQSIAVFAVSWKPMCVCVCAYSAYSSSNNLIHTKKERFSPTCVLNEAQFMCIRKGADMLM